MKKKHDHVCRRADRRSRGGREVRGLPVRAPISAGEVEVNDLVERLRSIGNLPNAEQDVVSAPRRRDEFVPGRILRYKVIRRLAPHLLVCIVVGRERRGIRNDSFAMPNPFPKISVNFGPSVRLPAAPPRSGPVRSGDAAAWSGRLA
ncbi:hypothetical protein FAGKG844_30011 [Frankia sp. AgKG'84/4]